MTDMKASWFCGLLDLNYALESYGEYEQEYEAADAESQPEDAIIEKNMAEVPVYTKEEVQSEALWHSNGHNGTADEALYYAGKSGVSISTTAASVFKKGAVAPDIYYMGSHFHGAITQNYITSYRFLTKIATLDGDTSKISKGVVGQSQYSVNELKRQISKTGIYQGVKEAKPDDFEEKWVSWKEVIGSEYTGSAARQAKLRRIFIYGMALHALTDTFAHDAYATYNGKKYRIEHQKEDGSPIWYADKIEQHPDRYEDAKYASRRVLIAYGNTTVGALTDFRPVDTTKERDYWLGELMTCAKKANYGFTDAQLKSFFGKLTYDGTGLTVN